ncbi:MAG: hypothetical protein DRO23_06560 [Thermoprotei archaeon]|nr:MAG: hypothetical protein DRO23_06560 [Thermoprotei archaeon]
MSTTVRLSREDKIRLEKLARKLNLSLAETLSYAISVAEKEVDKFEGDLNVLFNILEKAGNSGKKRVSERVDEELSKIIGER